jgi:hypothetical protein
MRFARVKDSELHDAYERPSFERRGTVVLPHSATYACRRVLVTDSDLADFE